RDDPARPVGHVPLCGLGHPRAKGVITDSAGRAIGIAALRRQQGRAVAGVVGVELTPHVLDEPPERRPGVVEQRDHALSGTGPAGTPFPMRTWSLPNGPSSQRMSARSKLRASLTPRPTSA